MPTSDSPEPVTADITLVAGTLRISAGGRAETTVEVHPRDAAKPTTCSADSPAATWPARS
ncbi:hypothetical protein KGD83_27080 [Nocardiopsis akebiae]|uniref:Uncharacterized protein n=1 Tax=Nocardiopsis akebiae TaxID=2831968 RepID=A0ABX8CC78_9ACTN|nr:hypothetical protein [Nocardiopsis akebiae]QUX32006.1 hypothetical protein KGD83_27080 [Nocardiopsis akebiae]